MDNLLLTKNQQIILRAFREFPIHPTAEQLHGFVHQTYPKIGLATVYRTLGQLVKMGKLNKISGLEAKDHYDHTLAPHSHFLCLQCGCVKDVPVKLCSVSLKAVEEELNVSCHSMELNMHGVCSECKNRGE